MKYVSLIICFIAKYTAGSFIINAPYFTLSTSVYDGALNGIFMCNSLKYRFQKPFCSRKSRKGYSKYLWLWFVSKWVTSIEIKFSLLSSNCRSWIYSIVWSVLNARGLTNCLLIYLITAQRLRPGSPVYSQGSVRSYHWLWALLEMIGDPK